MVRLPDRIHIFGASGTGTTSLAVAIATRYGHRHLDTDDFYWMRTDPPYREVRPPEDRLALLRRSIRVRRHVTLRGVGGKTVLRKNKQAGSRLAAPVAAEGRSVQVEDTAGLREGELFAELLVEGRDPLSAHPHGSRKPEQLYACRCDA